MNTIFKPELILSHYHWLSYGVILLVLMITLLILAKKYQTRTPLINHCQLIEKKHLSSKHVIYIIEYQQQRFLLADNQNALLLHPLTLEVNHDMG